MVQQLGREILQACIPFIFCAVIHREWMIHSILVILRILGKAEVEKSNFTKLTEIPGATFAPFPPEWCKS